MSAPTSTAWLRWSALAVASLGIVMVLWACVTEWGGITHGNPAYATLLGLTVAVSAIVIGRNGFFWRGSRKGWRRALRITFLVFGVAWVAAMAWLRPHTAVEPALAAMQSDDVVVVTESATQIVMAPTEESSGTGVFFQPGALVDARAYAAVLRPLVEQGHTVVIPKQPLGIAFFSLGAFESTTPAFPDVAAWVVGGHSLGGTVAAIEVESADEEATAAAVGLLFYASYPAGDISETLTARVESISGTEDGLATPAKVAASRGDLPPTATFTVVDGASHAQFGAYGEQSGDGTPTISDADAREQISAATLEFVDSFEEGAATP